MGIGLLLHEEVKYDMTTGRMLTNNTWVSKILGFYLRCILYLRYLYIVR